MRRAPLPAHAAATGYLGAQMDVIAQLETILPGLDEVAGRVKLEEFGNSTPCANFRVRDLFDHMIRGASQFAPQLRGEPVVALDPSDLHDDERQAALKTAVADLLTAVHAPGALGRSVELPFGVVPGAVLARFLTVDGMVHTWDIARATGQPFSPSEPLAEAVLANAHELIAPPMRDGDTFAPETAIAPEASAMERLVAFTGRVL
jgi:uncharacterized protein (TIGR03086 family)